MNKKVIFGIILLLILASAAIFLQGRDFLSKNTAPAKEERILHAITDNIPAFLYEGEPVIGIDSISTFDDKWHIVTIKSLRTSEKFVPVKIIMLDNGDELRIISGPDTHFTEPELLKYNVPDAVILELQKS